MHSRVAQRTRLQDNPNCRAAISLGGFGFLARLSGKFPVQGPVQSAARPLPTQFGWWPRPDLSEMSDGVGLMFRYQRLLLPLTVLDGKFTSARMSDVDKAAE